MKKSKEKVIKPIILERLTRACEEQPCYGVFDFVPEKFQELFPKWHDKGDALNTAFLEVFNTGLQIGFKTGQVLKEIEVEGEEIIKKNLKYTKESIKMDRRRIEREDFQNMPLL